MAINSIKKTTVSGVTLSTSTDNQVATVTGANALTGESNLTFDGSTLALTGAMTVSSTSTFSGDATFNDNVKATFGTGGDADIYYDGTNLVLEPQVVGSGAVVINDAANVFLNDTANAKMTTGLTLNQGGADNEILAFKSSDVAHGVTNVMETDTFAYVSKSEVTNGGFKMYSISAGTSPWRHNVAAGSWNTAKTTSALAAIAFGVAGISGNDATSPDANGNLFYIQHNGTGHAKFLVDAEGDYYYDGVDGGAFDIYADAELARAFTYAVSDPAQVVRSRWDDEVRYNEDDLVKANLIGYVSPEEKAQGVKPLVNGAQLQRLHHGAIWQLHQQLRNQEEEIKALRGELMRLQERNN